MTIATLAANVYEDINGQITSVTLGKSLTIKMECDDWDTLQKRRRFQIRCEGVIESTVGPSAIGFVDVSDDHCVLWPYNAPQGKLFFSQAHLSLPLMGDAVLGTLYRVHNEIFRGRVPLNTFVNMSLFSTKFPRTGLVAHGPEPLLVRYKNVLAQNVFNGNEPLLATGYVPTHRPNGGYQVLLFDSGFVVCRRVDAWQENEATASSSQ
uniref:hypothetical protein n=1 Tax=Thaumasiovibrio occultus TaxID=1891184 RepID=UPI000B34F8E7|nr:hypothetical protein [Thaumasiovibrio occultus]